MRIARDGVQKRLNPICLLDGGFLPIKTKRELDVRAHPKR
jgi:hypothetical protein